MSGATLHCRSLNLTLFCHGLKWLNLILLSPFCFVTVRTRKSSSSLTSRVATAPFRKYGASVRGGIEKWGGERERRWEERRRTHRWKRVSHPPPLACSSAERRCQDLPQRTTAGSADSRTTPPGAGRGAGQRAGEEGVQRGRGEPRGDGGGESRQRREG